MNNDHSFYDPDPLPLGPGWNLCSPHDRRWTAAHSATSEERFEYWGDRADGEPGQPLRISGEVFAPDGTTPVRDVFVYAYQTDADGHYQNDPTTHIARLHAFAKTDENGHFEFVTIHPGAYPSRQVPAHVHFHLYGAGYPLQWTNDLFFEGDRLLKPETIEEARTAGKFSYICALAHEGSGTELCHINFRLLEETNYAPQHRDDPRTR